jgi:hypothetical protein
MNIRYTRCLITLFITAFCSRTFAQYKQVDTASADRVSENMVDYFNKAVGQQSRIFTGPMFDPYKFVSKTNANFNDTTGFTTGTITYEGILYKDVPLIYNIERDLVESVLYNNFSVYTLQSERVEDFDIWGHHFIRLVPDSLNKQMDIGFYDELYHKKLQILVRREKSIQEETTTTTIHYVFTPRTNYYIKKRGLYYNINSQGKLLDVLKDKKKELKQFLKDKSIRYKDNPEQNMVLLVAYYDQLTK